MKPTKATPPRPSLPSCSRSPERVSEEAASRPSRRSLLKGFARLAAAGAIATPLTIAQSAWAAGSDEIRIGLVGCGGRGTGAAAQALKADDGNRLVAMGDLFEDQLNRSLETLRKQPEIGSRVTVDAAHTFLGLDAYQQVIAADVDVVLLATPPHFRPIHLRACIEADKHAFAEKPVAVDAPGVRSVLETTKLAEAKGLYLVSGLNMRYSARMQEWVERIHGGAIGDIVSLQAVRFGQGVWTRAREAGMSEMEYQLRNWYYFTWLSGDFNVEQFVHQLDLMSWINHGKYPVRSMGTGGRQARTGADHGHIFDHFSTIYDFEGEVTAHGTTRHQKGTTPESSTLVLGTKGRAVFARRTPIIEGENPWRPPREPEKSSHQLEHDAFFSALRDGRVINNGDYMAKSTMMAIMGRMNAYTGKNLTWDEAMASEQALVPSAYTMDADPPKAEVAIPGVTPFV